MQEQDREYRDDKIDEEKSEYQQEMEEEQEEEMPDSKSSDESKPELRVGIIPAPEAASDLSDKLAESLSDLLQYYVSDEYTWQVDVVVDSYIGAEEDADKTLKQAYNIASNYKWDYTVAITDIPLYKNGDFIVAEVDDKGELAQISFPALGMIPIYRRTREAVLQLLSEMHHGTSDAAREREQERVNQSSDVIKEEVKNTDTRELIQRGPQRHLLPIKREVMEDDNETSVRFTAKPKWSGYFRLTTGMVRANRPWRVILTFKSIIAIAFATGAYALIFPSMWMLADEYELFRAVAMMFISIIAMTAWIIVAHHLWENAEATSERKSLILLHNLSTMMTIALGVIVYYATLLVAFLFAVFIFLPPDMIASEEGINREPNPLYFVYLAWIVTSMATVVGAIGAGLEDEETVLKGTYGYRQRKRKEYLQEKEKEEEKKQEGE
ncbi:MFS transporter [Alkalicoccus chagannorensis]|uniref:MFS transporter n=1 Tax=Alkalicoccus chagannorensis TaxID=427072 RepID=UPI00041847FF|nr:MFS transporter [Alkalicoccus chagannorensis]